MMRVVADCVVMSCNPLFMDVKSTIQKLSRQVCDVREEVRVYDRL